MRKPGTPILVAVYFDAYEARRKCVALLAQSLRAPELLTDRPHEIEPRVATAEVNAKSSVARVAEFYDLNAQARWRVTDTDTERPVHVSCQACPSDCFRTTRSGQQMSAQGR